MSRQMKVDDRRSNPKVGDFDLVQERWQSRSNEGNSTSDSIDVEPEGRLKKKEHRSRGPGLRRACNRIEHGAGSRILQETAEEFGHAMQVEVHRSLEHSLKNSKHLFGESITSETVSDQGIVMGPHTAVMIGHRVISSFAFGHRLNTPTGKGLRRHQRLADQTSMIS